MVSIAVRHRRQRAEQNPPTSVPLVALGVHPAMGQPALRGNGFRFVQVSAGQRGLDQFFHSGFRVRVVSDLEELAPFLITGIAPPAEHEIGHRDLTGTGYIGDLVPRDTDSVSGKRGRFGLPVFLMVL